MGSTTHTSIRHRVNTNHTVGVATYCLRGSFDPTSASQVLLFTLPTGAIPLSVASYGGATGGTNPTVIVGTSGDDNGYADELDADTPAETFNGALLNTAVTSDTAVYGKVGSSAATGGTTSVVLHYTMNV